jgi:hypothetical protein
MGDLNQGRTGKVLSSEIAVTVFVFGRPRFFSFTLTWAWTDELPVGAAYGRHDSHPIDRQLSPRPHNQRLVFMANNR